MQNTEFLNSGLTEYSILVIIKKLCAVIVDSEANISDERKVKYLHRLASYQIKGEERIFYNVIMFLLIRISDIFCVLLSVWNMGISRPCFI